MVTKSPPKDDPKVIPASPSNSKLNLYEGKLIECTDHAFIQAFGYYFNPEGKLVSIKNGN